MSVFYDYNTANLLIDNLEKYEEKFWPVTWKCVARIPANN